MPAGPSLKRLLRIDQELASGRRPSTRALARLLEVSPRTIQRDLEHLARKAGAPIELALDRKGYRYRDPNYRFDAATGDAEGGDEIELRLEPALAARLLDRPVEELIALLAPLDRGAEIRRLQLRTDGGAELVFSTTDRDASLRRALALGPEAEIMGPPLALRRVRAILRQLTARYT